MGLRVSSQLSLLVGITATALTLVGAFFFYGVSRLDRVNSSRSVEQEILSHVTTLYISANEIRRLETEMLAGQFRESAFETRLARDRIDTLFGIAENELEHSILDGLSGARLSIIEEALEQVALYKTLLSAELEQLQQLGFGNDEGLHDEILTTSDAIAKRLKEGSLTAYLQMLENWPKPPEMSFFEHLAQARFDRVEYFDPVREELLRSGVPDSEINEIKSLTDAYFTNLENLSLISSSLADLRRTSSDLFLGFIFLVDELRAEALSRADRTRAEYNRISDQIAAIILIAVLVVAGGSILSGYFLGKRLSGQIRQISATSRKIAEGQTGVSVPLLGMNNEIGDMAQALQAFSETAEELRHLNLGLEDKIAERTRELEIQTRRAEESSKAKSTFLAHMSHEIRTPMNGVMGMVEILSSTDLTDAQRQLLDTINESADHLLRVIDDILDVSKIEAGKLDLEETEIDLLQLLERSIETLSTTARASNVLLVNNCDPSLPRYVTGDPVRLRQIILNLVGNAVKFAKKSTGEEGVARVQAGMGEDGYLYIRVIDNGIGMSQQTIDGLFTAFQQADSSTARHFGGTGLGLKITNRLVEMMGGRIEVESELGQGSVFTVYLPLKPAAKQSDRTDLSGVNMLFYFEGPMKPKGVDWFFAQHGASTTIYTDMQDFLTAVKQDAGDTIFVLCCVNEGRNEKLLGEIRQLGIPAKVMIFDPGRRSAKGLIGPDTYISHRFPIHYTDALHGIQVLRHREADLPHAEEGKAPDPAHKEAEGLPILLCEDNRINQEVLARQMQILGYSCDLAGNGREGLEKWETGQYGIVLTDCQMPEMDGYALAAAIRGREEERGLKRIPIIAVTANALKEEADGCIACGMDGVLTKPVKLEELRATLETWYPSPAVEGDERRLGS